MTGGGSPDGQLLAGPPLVAPRTSFNRPITPHRRWAFGSASLDDVKAVKTAFGVTVNDVVMAACAGALRRWLEVHRELPEQPLLAMVPLSVRTPEQQGQYGNRVSAMIAALPTHLPEPVDRLMAVHDAMRAAKEQHQAIGAETLQDVTQFTVPALATRAARVAAQMRVMDYVNPPYNVVISNVPGPRTPLYLAGATVLGYYPVSVVADGLGLNMTVQSYLDHLDFGLVSDRELVPDLWDLLGYLQDAITELHDAAKQRTA
jgi:WS/DGAT/MGAT family acyltransferase